MDISIFVGFTLLSIILILSSFSFKTSGAESVSINFDNITLQKLLEDYVNFNVNVPTAQLPEEGNQCLIKPGSVYLLLDPFSKGSVTQRCEIKVGSNLFFPFYEGWCDNGNIGLYGIQDFKQILDCALDSDKGIVTMIAWLDGKEVVNTKVNNKDVHNLKTIYDKYPGNDYYKIIKSPVFFDLTLTNKSRFTDNYEKPQDFESKPYTYKALAHCFCGLVTNLTNGNHELRYKTVIEGSAGLAQDTGWDQMTDITYELSVK